MCLTNAGGSSSHPGGVQPPTSTGKAAAKAPKRQRQHSHATHSSRTRARQIWERTSPCSPRPPARCCCHLRRRCPERRRVCWLAARRLARRCCCCWGLPPPLLGCSCCCVSCLVQGCRRCRLSRGLVVFRSVTGGWPGGSSRQGAEQNMTSGGGGAGGVAAEAVSGDWDGQLAGAEQFATSCCATQHSAKAHRARRRRLAHRARSPGGLGLRRRFAVFVSY